MTKLDWLQLWNSVIGLRSQIVHDCMIMINNIPLTRHSRAGGNPAVQTSREANKNASLSCFAGMIWSMDSWKRQNLMRRID